MIDCLILGDSIAVGTHMYRPECVAYAKGGINSWQWNKQNLEGDRGSNLAADNIIISLGSNDHAGVKTRRELERMRAAVHAKRVFWILPAGNLKAGGVDIDSIQQIVEDIANRNRDWIVRIPEVSKDGIHPTGRGYKEIARVTRDIASTTSGK
jgi:lysophospholipase L1-like esterase